MLFGEAVNLANQLINALQQGTQLGIGERIKGKRTAIKLVSVASVLPNKQQPGVVPRPLIEWFDSDLTPDPTELALHLNSPLRLKHQGQVQSGYIPDLYSLNTHACRRLTLLSQYWVTDDNALLSALRKQLPRLGEVESTHHTYFENWQRFSLTMKKPISFGGLKGQLSFYGDISPAKHWLQTAEVLGIGGKTTFGLGHITLIG
jgi:hypothetical protein